MHREDFDALLAEAIEIYLRSRVLEVEWENRELLEHSQLAAYLERGGFVETSAWLDDFWRSRSIDSAIQKMVAEYLELQVRPPTRGRQRSANNPRLRKRR